MTINYTYHINKNLALAAACAFVAATSVTDGGVEAFVPVIHNKSPPSAAPGSSFTATTPVIVGLTTSTSTGRTGGTSLSMMAAGNGNLVDRLFRVVRSNVNKFVASIENPEKVIVQAVDDMQVRCAVINSVCCRCAESRDCLLLVGLASSTAVSATIGNPSSLTIQHAHCSFPCTE